MFPIDFTKILIKGQYLAYSYLFPVLRPNFGGWRLKDDSCGNSRGMMIGNKEQEDRNDPRKL